MQNTEARALNDPIAVYTLGEDIIFQLLRKSPPPGSDRQTWLVAGQEVGEPVTIEEEDVEVIASWDRVWSEGDGPLPAKYRLGEEGDDEAWASLMNS